MPGRITASRPGRRCDCGLRNWPCASMAHAGLPRPRRHHRGRLSEANHDMLVPASQKRASYVRRARSCGIWATPLGSLAFEACPARPAALGQQVEQSAPPQASSRTASTTCTLACEHACGFEPDAAVGAGDDHRPAGLVRNAGTGPSIVKGFRAGLRSGSWVPCVAEGQRRRAMPVVMSHSDQTM